MSNYRVNFLVAIVGIMNQSAPFCVVGRRGDNLGDYEVQLTVLWNAFFVQSEY